MTRHRLTVIAIALTLAAAAQPAAAQPATDCFDRAKDAAGITACEQSAAAAFRTITPGRAYELKEARGDRVLLFDVRSRAEVALVGAPGVIDAVVPLAELAHPLQEDPERRDLRMDAQPGFVDTAGAWVAVLGGDRQTPVILICRSGERARTAARLLREAGYMDVSVVEGGFEGPLGRDGVRRGGWKDSGLPWVARVDPERIFGSRE